MKTVFVFEQVAVVVMPWWEPMDPPERGTRVEVRLVDHEPRRGSRFAAQRIAVDKPVWRADLFDQVTSPPGNLLSAHFHPGFNGNEPCPRVWDPDIRSDPLAWLGRELSDLDGLLSRSGAELSADQRAELVGDAAALRDTVGAIVSAVESTWELARSR